MFASFLKQLYGTLDGLQDNLLGILCLEAHLYAAFYIGSYIAHGVSDGTRHSGSCWEETFFHDEAFAQFIEDFCNLLDFCSRCIYRSDEGHRLLVGDGDVWHHEEEGWGDTILVQPLLDVG